METTPHAAIPPDAKEAQTILTLHQEHPICTARRGALFKLFYLNLLATIVTLGIYRFWAKVRMRRYLWRHITVGGVAFEYTGTGKELLIGFAKALLILVPLFAVFAALKLLIAPAWAIAINVLQGLVIFGLTPLGLYAARRYRMSRTNWSGIRFHQAGSPWRYAGLYLKGMVLLLLTGYLALPYFQARLKSYETENLHFGSQPFSFAGKGGDLFKKWLVAWLLLIPTLGLSGLWYAGHQYRYFAAQTRLAGLQLGMTVRGRDLFGLYLANLLILGFSIGLLYPVVIRRNFNFWCRHLTIDGALDLSMVRQADRGPRSGEGLASFLDLEFLGA